MRSRKVERHKQISVSEGEDEEYEITYNPQNLPLDWDGKPIPYSIDINYNCEICGKYTY